MSVERTRVVVAGACGRMGRETCKAVLDAEDMELVGVCDTAFAGGNLADVVEGAPGIRISGALDDAIAESSPDVVVDFTTPSAVMENIRTAVRRSTSIVVGTTGVALQDLASEDKLARESGFGILIAPNFAIGAVLMMKFAEEASKHLPTVEIIELHHDRKLDAPSGTALITAEKIAGARGEVDCGGPQPEARGALHKGVRIHSVRLPGLVAHQEVIFGGVGQTLTIRHDSLDRTSFMPGVLLAVRKMKEIRGIVYGLDRIL
ncbi:MAG: 4-hydroxy-tetrahydrodipicolinate reductase [Armatimonadota bacterium]|nr:4-hydroxy-tetrahydrodipicolinate reductase [Armatimonadota bacterium]